MNNPTQSQFLRWKYFHVSSHAKIKRCFYLSRTFLRWMPLLVAMCCRGGLGGLVIATNQPTFIEEHPLGIAPNPWYTNNGLATNLSEVAEFATNSMFDPAALTLRLDTVTNWTGVNHDGQELGYVVTNHVAVIYYQGATNEFTLKTTASEIAKWRKVQPLQWIIATNQVQPFIWPGESGLTNIYNYIPANPNYIPPQ